MVDSDRAADPVAVDAETVVVVEEAVVLSACVFRAADCGVAAVRVPAVEVAACVAVGNAGCCSTDREPAEPAASCVLDAGSSESSRAGVEGEFGLEGGEITVGGADESSPTVDVDPEVDGVEETTGVGVPLSSKADDRSPVEVDLLPEVDGVEETTGRPLSSEADEDSGPLEGVEAPEVAGVATTTAGDDALSSRPVGESSCGGVDAEGVGDTRVVDAPAVPPGDESSFVIVPAVGAGVLPDVVGAGATALGDESSSPPVERSSRLAEVAGTTGTVAVVTGEASDLEPSLSSLEWPVA